MPINIDAEELRVDYQIPPEISARIPEYFYIAFAGELFGVFGWDRAKAMFYPEETMDYADLDSGSVGWVAAFKMTCRKLALFWLVDYYETLPWYDSDVFDGIMEQEIFRRFMSRPENGPNGYYRYLSDRESFCTAERAEEDETEKI